MRCLILIALLGCKTPNKSLVNLVGHQYMEVTNGYIHSADCTNHPCFEFYPETLMKSYNPKIWINPTFIPH